MTRYDLILQQKRQYYAHDVNNVFQLLFKMSCRVYCVALILSDRLVSECRTYHEWFSKHYWRRGGGDVILQMSLLEVIMVWGCRAPTSTPLEHATRKIRNKWIRSIIYRNNLTVITKCLQKLFEILEMQYKKTFNKKTKIFRANPCRRR